jgi:hypothetical protein
MSIVAAVVVAVSARAANEPDLQMQTRIRQEGFRNSKVMELAAALTDLIGARLTGSPEMKRANEWTRDKLRELGLANAHLEPFAFGRGWSYELCTVRMLTPDFEPLYGIPKAWSPGTNGPVRAKVAKVKLESKEDLDRNGGGKYAGMILFTADAREMKLHETPQSERYSEAQLGEMSGYAIPGARDAARSAEYTKRRAFRKALAEWAAAEKVLAIVDPGSGDEGTFTVQQSGSYKEGEPAGVTAVALAPEHYNRIVRLLEQNTPVELELNVATTFHDADRNAYNTIAEIPGSDKRGEVVMLGAHLDSWHSGTGATDNAAGSAVVMEAARILRAIGVTPKRTIRVALWAGEEQGLLGSRAYVAEHFGSRPEPSDPAERDLPLSMRKERPPLRIKPEHAKLAAYFNLDNGGGRIRGIYMQENAAVRPIFEPWLDAVRDLGATTLTMRNTTSTDHISFDEVGLPGFQFVQDELEYLARSHHTNWDTYERLQREDLMQAAVVLATFVWESANRPEMLPRKPWPVGEPKPVDVN